MNNVSVKDIFNNTVHANNIQNLDKDTQGEKISFEDTDQHLCVDEIYENDVAANNESLSQLKKRIFYRYSNNQYIPAYTETFLDNIPVNSGFVSEIAKGDSKEVIGYRYYKNKSKFRSNEYFTIIKNEKFKSDRKEPEYLIADNCGGEIDGAQCNKLMFDLLHNQFKDKFGHEITGNKIISDAFVATLQQQYKNHPSINLCNVNLGNQPNKSPIFDLDDIVKYLPTDKISLIPINTEGHATVLLYNPDNKKNNKFYLFDSSGALSDDNKTMKKVFKKENIGKIDTKSLNIKNIQLNGSCTMWSDCFIKHIITKNDGIKYNTNFFTTNIKVEFDNIVSQVGLCQQMDRIFKNLPTNLPTIKIYINEQEAKNDTNNYFILKAADRYYGINKYCYHNNYLNISRFVKENKLKGNLNTAQLNNVIKIQQCSASIQYILNEFNKTLNIIKNNEFNKKLLNKITTLTNTATKTAKEEAELNKLKNAQLIIQIAKQEIIEYNKVLKFFSTQNEKCKSLLDNNFEANYSNSMLTSINIKNSLLLDTKFRELYRTISNLQTDYSDLIVNNVNKLNLQQYNWQSNYNDQIWQNSKSDFQQPQIDLTNLQQIINTQFQGIQGMHTVNKDNSNEHHNNQIKQNTQIQQQAQQNTVPQQQELVQNQHNFSPEFDKVKEIVTNKLGKTNIENTEQINSTKQNQNIESELAKKQQTVNTTRQQVGQSIGNFFQY